MSEQEVKKPRKPRAKKVKVEEPPAVVVAEPEAAPPKAKRVKKEPAEAGSPTKTIRKRIPKKNRPPKQNKGSWADALEEFNKDQLAAGKVWGIPKRGSDDYTRVREIQQRLMKKSVTA